VAGPVIIRPATIDDADELAAVLVASWRAAYAGLLPAEFLADLDVAARGQQWREILGAGSGTALVAHRADRMAGFVAVGPALDGAPGEGALYAIYVDPASWGTGIGHRLHEAGLQALREQGFAEVGLWVLRDNARAITFYQRHGWSLDGRSQIDRYFAGLELDEVGLRRPL
jgi:ribosomal protein S18 acetylase RimI-like enzyme